jgi:formylglycine-generating enzyme required for sulfatase activity
MACQGSTRTASRTCSRVIAMLSLLAVIASGCSTMLGPSEPNHDTPAGMVFVPAGSFIMGDGVAHCGVSEHRVTLTRHFYLGQHEVTNAEYVAALQWAYNNGYVAVIWDEWVLDNLDGSDAELLWLAHPLCEIGFSDGVFAVRDAKHGMNPDHPVKLVTWFAAVRYCDWLSLQEDPPLERAYQHSGEWLCNDGDPYGAEGYRLPTDAEWEYAAQYNDERIYPWGDASPSCALANYSGCVGWTSPVGSHPAGNSRLHLSDMAGNVREWCNDLHVCDLGTDPVIDPAGPTSVSSYPYRVLHGGAWAYDVSSLRCAGRYRNDPHNYADTYCGFRVARTVNP